MLTPKNEPSTIGLVGLLFGLVGGHYDARMARGRERLIVGAALLFFTMFLAAMLAYNAWLGDRFVNHSVIVDARLVDRIDIQCIGASGGGLLGSGTNTWWVEFPVPEGLHQTRLVHPCDVTPPDFGRGRGYMWMQYDEDNYDRTRVLNDTTAEDSVRPLTLGLIVWVPATAVIWRLWFRRGGTSGTKPVKSAS